MSLLSKAKKIVNLLCFRIAVCNFVCFCSPSATKGENFKYIIVFRTFSSVIETPYACEHLNESLQAVLSNSNIYAQEIMIIFS